MFSLTKLISGGRCGQTTDLPLLPSHLWVPFDNHRVSETSWGRCKTAYSSFQEQETDSSNRELVQASPVQTQEVTDTNVQGSGKWLHWNVAPGSGRNQQPVNREARSAQRNNSNGSCGDNWLCPSAGSVWFLFPSFPPNPAPSLWFMQKMRGGVYWTLSSSGSSPVQAPELHMEACFCLPPSHSPGHRWALEIYLHAVGGSHLLRGLKVKWKC